MDNPQLFDFVNDITVDKIDLLQNPDNEKLLNCYMVNMALSMNMDTIMYADQMNRLHELPKKLQYAYLFHSIRKRKRYPAWPKKQDLSKLEMVAEYYQCSIGKARVMMKLLSDAQLKTIEALSFKGD
jgi:hypothetical protein